MSCFHPLIAFPGKLTENGKVQYIPMPVDASVYEDYQSKEWIKVKEENQRKLGNKYYPPIMIPCGKCIGCRLDKSREWALRCMMELKSQKGIAIFITLTYNETKVPISYFADPETGEALPCYSLRLDDLQRFWKRLRKAFPEKKLRYFASGEYGSETWRPHYHAIVFGLCTSDFDDLVLTQVNETGNYYRSDSLNRIWNSGNVIIANVTFDTCAYVARYTAKKNLTLQENFFESHNLEKPFLVMSRRPGIGWAYMQERSDYFELDHVYIGGTDAVDGSVPKSFVRKLESIDKELFDEITERRKTKGTVYERAIAMSRKVPYSKLLSDSEQNLLARAKAIKRNKV